MGRTVIIATHNNHMVERMGYPRMLLDEGWMEIVGGSKSPPVESPAEPARNKPPAGNGRPDWEKLI